MECKLCGEKVKQSGFSGLLNNDEKRRFIGLEKTQDICLECKTTLLMIGVISPW